MDAKEAIRILGKMYKAQPINERLSIENAALSTAISALEKQVPKEPILQPDEEPPFEFEHYRCPNCRCIIHQHYKKSRQPRGKFVKICPECGQAINNDKE